MASPFPGMDPYLEERAIWPDVHQRLIAYISEALQPLIAPKYMARIGERVQLATFGRSYVPDTVLVHQVREAQAAYAPEASLVADQAMTMDIVDEERRVPFLEIVLVKSGEVVTLLEVLSPANKEAGGRDDYLQKQRDLLRTEVNIVEIDLLGYGRHTVLARRGEIEEPEDWRYIVSVSRGNARGRMEAYPVPLRQRLPRCRIPLHPEDEDVVLDLPAVFNRCYNAARYDLLVDYTQPPDTPLTEAEQNWLDEWLREKGLRSVDE